MNKVQCHFQNKWTCVLPTACALSKNLINKDRPYLSDKTNTCIWKMLYIS